MKRSALLAAAAVLALAGCSNTPPPASESVQKYYNENVANAKPVLPVSSGAPAKPVSLISDSHAHNASSWWRETIGAGAVPGAQMHNVQSFPGSDSESILRRVEPVKYAGGYVVLQAGTNDLRQGDDAAQTVAGVKTVVALIRENQGKPVLALVPPSDEQPAVAKAVNELLVQWADAEKIPVVDVYTPVADPDGSWKDGLSDDMIHANKAGAAKMAAAAQVRLTAIFQP